MGVIRAAARSTSSDERPILRSAGTSRRAFLKMCQELYSTRSWYKSSATSRGSHGPQQLAEGVNASGPAMLVESSSCCQREVDGSSDRRCSLPTLAPAETLTAKVVLVRCSARPDVAVKLELYARGVIASLIGFLAASQFITVYGLELPHFVAMIGAGLLKVVSEDASSKVPAAAVVSSRPLPTTPSVPLPRPSQTGRV